MPAWDRQVRVAALPVKGEPLPPGVVVVPAFEIGLVQSSQPKMLGAAGRKELTRSWST